MQYACIPNSWFNQGVKKINSQYVSKSVDQDIMFVFLIQKKRNC